MLRSGSAHHPPAPARARVLMVGPWPPTKGGVTTFMRNVVRSSLSHDYEFIPFTTSRPGKRNVAHDNYGYAAVFRGGLKRVVQGISLTLWHVMLYPWVVVTRRPAVIQIQASDFQAFWEAALYVAMGKALRRPLVVRIGGSFDRFYLASGGCARAVIRWVLRQPAVLLVQSQYWKAFVAQLGRAADVSILPNFVKESLIVPRTSPAPAKLRFLLCSGEVPRLKGAYVLLDAMRQLAARGVAADVRIMAATGPLRRAIEDAGLGERVTALDFMEHDEALAALRDTDVFLQISTSEGFPNALLEAMALGCAAIVTPVGAIPEIVGDDGGCAFVIPVGDVRGLAEAMETLVHDRPMVARMAQAAQQRVLARYTESAVISVLDDAWRRARRQRCALATLTEHGLR